MRESLLVIDKFVRLFVKTLPADDKHYRLNRDKLAQPIHMQLFQKQKSFSQLFFGILKSSLNFKHLPKNDDCHR